MKRNVLLLSISLILIAGLISCRTAEEKKVKIRDFSFSKTKGFDLTKELPYALLLNDSVHTGFKAGKHTNLLSVRGAVKHKRQNAEIFQTFQSSDPQILFFLIDKIPKHLKLKLKSPGEGTIVVFFNGNYLKEINCKTGIQNFLLRVPPRFQQKGVNTLEFKKGAGGEKVEDTSFKITLKELSIQKNNESYGVKYEKPARRATVSRKDSRIPVLKQNRNSEIRFYKTIPKDALLSVGVKPEENTGWSIRIRNQKGKVRIYDSNNFDKKDLSEIRIPLDEFENEISEITFKVTGSSPNKPFIWYNPVVEDSTEKKDLQERPAATVRLKNKTGVIFISLGSAFWKRFSAGGNKRKTTPNIDQLTEDSIVYENAYCSTGKALDSVLGMMTGIYPDNLKMLRNTGTFPRPGTTAAEAFFESGYRTAGYVNRSFLKFKTGMNSGFEIFNNLHIGSREYETTRKLTGKAKKWIEEFKNKPGFLYLHYIQPGQPFTPPAKFQFPSDYTGEIDGSPESIYRRKTTRQGLSRKDQKEIKRLYDGNLKFIDDQVGKLLGFLKKKGIYRKSLIILTSDTGAALGENGVIHTKYDTGENSLNVPLIIKPPESADFDSKRIFTPVSTVDILPTLNRLYELDLDRNLMQGTPLPGFTESPASGSAHASTGHNRFPRYVEYFGNFKFATCSSPLNKKLYALSKDPGERTNLIGENPVLGGFLRAQNLKWLNGCAAFSKKLNGEIESKSTGDSR